MLPERLGIWLFVPAGINSILSEHSDLNHSRFLSREVIRCWDGCSGKLRQGVGGKGAGLCSGSLSYRRIFSGFAGEKPPLSSKLQHLLWPLFLYCSYLVLSADPHPSVPLSILHPPSHPAGLFGMELWPRCLKMLLK